jgi:hypothetical protein
MYDTLVRIVLELVILARLPQRDPTAEDRALFKLIRASHDELARRRFGTPAPRPAAEKGERGE